MKFSLICSLSMHFLLTQSVKFFLKLFKMRVALWNCYTWCFLLHTFVGGWLFSSHSCHVESFLRLLIYIFFCYFYTIFIFLFFSHLFSIKHFSYFLSDLNFSGFLRLDYSWWVFFFSFILKIPHLHAFADSATV